MESNVETSKGSKLPRALKPYISDLGRCLGRLRICGASVRSVFSDAIAILRVDKGGSKRPHKCI